MTKTALVQDQEKIARFEQMFMPHMDAAYNLARWLTNTDADAQDIVQEAYLRAFKFFSGFRGDNSRSWLLRIVRNEFYDWLKRNRRVESVVINDQLHDLPDEARTPDTSLIQKAEAQELHRAIAELPLEFREILVLRELEGLSYKEIAELSQIPMGTVMSRLARAREQLRILLAPRLETL